MNRILYQLLFAFLIIFYVSNGSSESEEELSSVSSEFDIDIDDIAEAIADGASIAEIADEILDDLEGLDLGELTSTLESVISDAGSDISPDELAQRIEDALREFFSGLDMSSTEEPENIMRRMVDISSTESGESEEESEEEEEERRRMVDMLSTESGESGESEEEEEERRRMVDMSSTESGESEESEEEEERRRRRGRRMVDMASTESGESEEEEEEEGEEEEEEGEGSVILLDGEETSVTIDVDGDSGFASGADGIVVLCQAIGGECRVEQTTVDETTMTILTCGVDVSGANAMFMASEGDENSCGISVNIDESSGVTTEDISQSDMRSSSADGAAACLGDITDALTTLDCTGEDTVDLPGAAATVE